ncbi:MAG: TlpA family protein disulfide reductase [Chloroflexota bacterium]|nr:TlpA family protein disulfide reductase [Chloroflexota bacterium]
MLPEFTLADATGATHAFPSDRIGLLCFVKEDCPTCHLSMPLIEGAHRAFGAAVDVRAVGQDAAGNATLVERYKLTLPMLDDSALRVSHRFDLDTVPTIVLADGRGNEVRRFVGFGRHDWQELFAEMAKATGLAAPDVDWSAYPEMRPGCGSKSVEPGIAERFAAEASGSPLRARRIEIAEHDDAFEFMFEQGLTDGLPVIPPIPERVLRMLAGTRRDAQDVVAVVPPNMAPATVEKVAANAVMAGCKPEYLPVVIAALEAVCTDEFNVHGVMATTWGATPCIVVNGPVRQRIGMNMGLNALGQGNRANATIGRALKLVLRNVGGSQPGGTERPTLGWPGRFTMCFAEWEERSPWEPMHVERGFRADESVVTLLAVEGPHQIADQTSRTARGLAGSFGLGLESFWHPKSHMQGDVLLVVCPEHADTIARECWTKDDIRARVQEITARPLRELMADEDSGEGMLPRWYGPAGPTQEQLAKPIPKFRDPKYINIAVAGSEAGKFSTAFGGWVSGTLGSVVVSRKIEEVL